jgi:hypothetical protein
MDFNHLHSARTTLLNQRWYGEDSISSASIWDRSSYREAQPIFQAIESAIADRFRVISVRKDDWDKKESKAPSAEAIESAKPVIINATRILGRFLVPASQPTPPFITTDEEGAVTVQWNYQGRELHLRFTATDAEYTKVWGTNIHSEMEEDYLKDDSLKSLCQWLLYGSTHRR